MRHIRALRAILTWDEGIEAHLDVLEAGYTEALLHAFGGFLGRLAAADPAAAAALMQPLASLTTPELETLLRHPTTSRRLTLVDRYEPADTARYLGRMIAEQDPPSARDLQPADVVVAALADRIYLRGEDRQAAAEEAVRVQRIAADVAAVVPCAMTMVMRCAREIVICQEPHLDTFRSNSPQGLVGRAMLTNCHEADEVALAEALVHEATHGLVGMSEAQGLVFGGDLAWLQDPYPYDGVSRVTSPWTGTRLDVPTYLHAVFVWFGLLGFWSRAYLSGRFPSDRVRARIHRSARGFVGGQATSELDPFRSILSVHLMETLDGMSAQVVDHMQESLA